MSKAHVSARHEAASAENYAWIWVLPTPDGRFRVALIEVPKHFVDTDQHFFEDDLTTRFLRIVDNIDEVESAVREAGVDPENLEAPWHNGFPV